MLVELSDRAIGAPALAAVGATVGVGEAVLRALAARVPAALRGEAASPRERRAAPLPAQALVYELLDAHVDTANLAADMEGDLRWAAHLDYLRALQRVGRETLAQMSGSFDA